MRRRCSAVWVRGSGFTADASEFHGGPIRKLLTRNGRSLEPTPSLQQNAKYSADGMTARAPFSTLSASPSISFGLATWVHSRLRRDFRHT
jgi:hypothetical protein